MESGFYHICIEVEGNSELIIETDIGETDLVQRIIHPWEIQGNDGFYCGKLFVQKYQVRRIDIFKTNIHSDDLESDTDKNFGQGISSIKRSAMDKWKLIEQMGENVTLRFTKHPISPWRDKKQICLDGHIITSSYEYKPHTRKAYCDICGKRTITECPKCHEPIPGDLYKNYYLYSGENEPPIHCDKCGRPFPWKKNKLQVNQEDVDNPLAWLQSFFSRFHPITVQLGKRYNNRPTLEVGDEYDIQDIIHCFLLLKFEDIRSEEWTPSYAGRSSRMDFLLKNEGIVIESKMTRQGHGTKEIGDELLIDITRYKGSSNCKILVCFIYDPSSIIENPKGFVEDLEKVSTKDLKVRVFMSP